MESESAFRERLVQIRDSVVEFLNNQVWFQELKTKWEELDPRSKSYLQFAITGSIALLLIGSLLSAWWSTSALRSDLYEKRALMSFLQNATEEMKSLKDAVPASASAPSAPSGSLTPSHSGLPSAGAKESAGAAASSAGGAGGADSESSWRPYFETLTTGAGVDKSNLSVAGEKAGHSNGQSKELMFELSLKHVNLRQVVRYAFALENGQKPVKLRNLVLDSKGDPSGYLDATLAVSTFTLVSSK